MDSSVSEINVSRPDCSFKLSNDRQIIRTEESCTCRLARIISSLISKLNNLVRIFPTDPCINPG